MVSGGASLAVVFVDVFEPVVGDVHFDGIVVFFLHGVSDLVVGGHLSPACFRCAGAGNSMAATCKLHVVLHYLYNMTR